MMKVWRYLNLEELNVNSYNFKFINFDELSCDVFFEMNLSIVYVYLIEAK
jgi:hypothetical protein